MYHQSRNSLLQFELLVKIMLTAPFVGIKHAFPIMKKQDSVESSIWPL